MSSTLADSHARPRVGVKQPASTRKKGSLLKDPRLLQNHKIKIKSACQDVSRLMVQVESKQPVPLFKGSQAPCSLVPPFVGYVLNATAESKLLSSTLSSMFADREYSFRITTALNMSSTGTGSVNSVIMNQTIASVSAFTNLGLVFNEFFLEKMIVQWEPVSMYNYPLTGSALSPVSGTVVSSLPLGCADLQHSQATYTSLTAMTENHRYDYENTGRPFTKLWKNTESRASTVNTTSGSISASSQSWQNTSLAAEYAGGLQFIAQPAPPALPVTTVLGTFTVEWLAWFRVRL